MRVKALINNKEKDIYNISKKKECIYSVELVLIV